VIVPIAPLPVPQNPILLAAAPRAGYGEFAHAFYSLPMNPFRGMGEFANAQYSAPQNPFAKGMGCGCPIFDRGMGQTETTLPPDTTAGVTSTITTTLDQYLTDISNAFQTGTSSSGGIGFLGWVAVGFGLYVLYWLATPGGAEYQRKRSDLESQYRGYRRVGRTAKTVGGAIVPAGLTRKKVTYRRRA